MPKENPYLIENKKPVETVYEIKDEYKIPSFEEFMENYEYDANLNYDDLNSDNIGTPKGYGPVDWKKKRDNAHLINTLNKTVGTLVNTIGEMKKHQPTMEVIGKHITLQLRQEFVRDLVE